MRPTIATALLWLPIACVATNPAWDGSPVADDESGSSGDRIATASGDSSAGTAQGDATGAGETTTGLAEDTDAGTTVLPSETGLPSGTGEDSEGGSTAAGESTSTGPVGCAEGEHLCGGQCVDPNNDKRACGLACVDCTELFGNNARCELGICHAHGGDDDGDDGDDD
ncbi:MAG: hypothetical protein IAG13_21040 [Deltaproteobacteria bacterium]|nr:hypothetical protein [Nannocystaceae bacterium]